MRTAAPGILPVIALDRSSGRPLYRQLYDGYRDAVAARQLRAGQRLPSTRSLAAELGISRIPVLNAFEQLLAEGYFESRVGSGTFVAEAVPEGTAPIRRDARRPPPRPAPRPIARNAARLPRELPEWYRSATPFAMGRPPLDQFPLRIWSSLVGRHARRADPSLLPYSGALGYEPLREAIAEYLRTARGVRCEADQVMIVGGSQQAIDLTARVLLDPDSPVWIEDPCYFGMRNALRAAGARLVPVPVDDEGLIVSAGIQRCPGARAAFVTPSHQCPLGVTMSASRRLRLLDWAQEAGAWIVEDDYDSEYRFGQMPVASLQGLDRAGRVLYMGTFTKILFPAIRIGYVVAPPDLMPTFIAVRRAMDMFSPTFLQAVLTDFIREGHFARHVRRMRVLCSERRQALVEALDRELGGTLHVEGDAAGMFLTASLPPHISDREAAQAALRAGLRTPPLSECCLGRRVRNGLILGYGGFDRKELSAAVTRLGAVLRPLAQRAISRADSGRSARSKRFAKTASRDKGPAPKAPSQRQRTM